MRVQLGGKERFDFLYSLLKHPVKALSAPAMAVTDSHPTLIAPLMGRHAILVTLEGIRKEERV